MPAALSGSRHRGSRRPSTCPNDRRATAAQGELDECGAASTVLQLAVITLLPVAPLLVTMVSLEELLKRPLQVVF